MKRAIVTSDNIDTIDFTPTVILGFYQSHKRELFSDCCHTLRIRFPYVDIIGCSSESNIYDLSPHLDEDGRNICIFMCVDIAKDAYTIQRVSSNRSEEIEIKRDGKYRALMLVSSYFQEIEDTLIDIQKHLEDNGLFGGIAGVVDPSVEQGDIYYDGDYWHDSLLIWLIDQEKYLLEGVTTHHFQPVGFKMQVTEAKGNTIYKIENRPALDTIEDIIGKLTPSSIASFEHPFFLSQYTHYDLDEAPLYSIQAIDRRDKSITMYRNIRNGDTIKVGISLGRNEQKENLRIYNKYSNRVDAVAFVFNCVGVKGYLGIMESLYLIHLRKSLKVPFMGFHTYGEIGQSATQHTSILHNQTISLAILSQR